MVLGLLLGGFLLWFLFKDTDWAKVRVALAEANWFWVFIAFVGVFLSFFTRTQRWGYIVRTAGPVSYRTLFNATQIGFLANYTLPGRVGEVVRALVLARSRKLPFSKCMAFVALDRVTDLAGLFITLVVSVVAFRPDKPITLPVGIDIPEWAHPLLDPQVIRQGAMMTAGVMGAFVAMLAVLYTNQWLFLRISDAIIGLVSKRLAGRVHDMVVHFAEGLHVFRSASDMLLALLWSLFTWTLAGLSFIAMFAAFSLELPWYAPFFILAMLSIAISFPGTPGFIGQYHIGIMLPLVILAPTIPNDTASAIAILVHLLNLAAVGIAGVYSLNDERVGLLGLQREAEAEQQQA